MLPNHPIKRNMLYMCVLHQDREGRLASVPEHIGEFWWHHHCWWRHSCCQHLQDGRPQVSLWHSRMQHIDWFCSLLRCVSVSVMTATWLLWIAFHLLLCVFSASRERNANSCLFELVSSYAVFTADHEDAGRVGVPASVCQQLPSYLRE